MPQAHPHDAQASPHFFPATTTAIEELLFPNSIPMSIQLFRPYKRQRSPSLTVDSQRPAKRHAGSEKLVEQMQSQPTQPPSPKRQRSHSLSLEEAPRAKRHAGSEIRAQSPPAAEDVVVTKTTITDLPPEILALIFQEVFPPYSLQAKHPALELETNRAWRGALNAKKTLMFVCRAWCSIARPFLYRDITIPSLRGLDALWWTLHHDNSLGYLIRGLTFTFDVAPESIFSPEDKSRRDMQDIVARCRHLNRLDFFPAGERGYCPEAPLPYIPPSVNSLGFNSLVNSAQLRVALRPWTCDRLHELRIIFIDPIDGHEKMTSEPEPMSFAKLDTLHLLCNGTCLTSGWEMPKLRRVIFHRSPTDCWTEYLCFLRDHGPRLEYLEFADREHEGDWPCDYEALLKLCPRLQHVVLPAYLRNRISEGTTFPSLRRVDFWWGRTGQDGDGGDDPVAMDRKPWPNVETIRHLDRALADLIPDLPRACDPRDSGEGCSLAWPRLAVLKRQGDVVEAHVLLPTEEEIAEAGGMGIQWREDDDDGLVVHPQPEAWGVEESDADDEPGEDDEPEEDGVPAADEPQSMLGPVRRILWQAMPQRVFAWLGQ
ncbi:hypothetical protein C8R46DRAFT_1296156 [Mycena filopes]|nr:hypothetical protein C8R46DRAFT_1296156 [Mycena filopes]